MKLVAGSLIWLCVLWSAHAGFPVLQLSDKLLTPVLKRDYSAFVRTIQEENLRSAETGKHLDMNVPDSEGKLLIVEAAQTGDIRFLDALLNYGAVIHGMREANTGLTPLHVAVQGGYRDVVRLLLAYGSSPDTEDSLGRTPRQLLERLPDREARPIRALLIQYDRYGPVIFEELPGSWRRAKSGSSQEFWFNANTSESRWNTPPSCAWQRWEVKGHPAKFTNAVTGQETPRIPAALSWRHVHKTGHGDMWHNWASNISQMQEPHELPPYMLKELKEQKNHRWLNARTGDISWEDPRYHSHWREIKHDDGVTFYYNIDTEATQHELPDDFAWTKVDDDEDESNHYFKNTKTGETTKEAPHHLAWTKHDSDL